MVADEPYPNLLGQRGGRGFPTLAFMDESGEVLDLLEPSERRVDQFNSAFEVLNSWRTMKAKFEAGDESVGFDLLVIELEMGQIDFPEAARRRSALQKLSRRRERQLDELLTVAESEHIHEASTGPQVAGPMLVEMMEGDRIPTGEPGKRFFDTILDYANGKKDARLFHNALVEMKRHYRRERGLSDYFKTRDRQLVQLRRGK